MRRRAFAARHLMLLPVPRLPIRPPVAVTGIDNADKGTDNAFTGTDNADKGTSNAATGTDNADKRTDDALRS